MRGAPSLRNINLVKKETLIYCISTSSCINKQTTTIRRICSWNVAIFLSLCQRQALFLLALVDALVMIISRMIDIALHVGHTINGCDFRWQRLLIFDTQMCVQVAPFS